MLPERSDEYQSYRQARMNGMWSHSREARADLQSLLTALKVDGPAIQDDLTRAQFDVGLDGLEELYPSVRTKVLRSVMD